MKLSRSQFAIAFVTYVAGIAGGLVMALALMIPPARAAEANKWSGCYAGAGVSYDSANAVSVFGAEGPGVAPYIGCDLQVQRFVIGPWADYSWDWYKWAGNNINTHGWAVGGRGGYLITPDVLAYGLVGYGDTTAKAFGASLDLTGIEWGGGLEVALGSNVYGQLQYKHEDLSKGVIDAKDNEVRVGLSYKLNWAGFNAPPVK